MDFKLIKKIIDDTAEKNGITEYEIYNSEFESVSADTLGNEISSFSSSVSGGICFRCRIDGKMGYASTELFEEDELSSLVLRAAENAKSLEKEDSVGIFGGSPSYEKTNVPVFTPLTADEVKTVALDIQKKTYAASDKVVDGTSAGVQAGTATVRIANSNGLYLENTSGLNIIYSAPVVKDKEESHNNFELCEYGKDSVDDVAKKAVEGALSKLGAKTVSTGKYSIVIESKQMRSLLAVFSEAFSSKMAQVGLSRLAGKEGEKIAADIINITDDPMREGVSIQTPFDAEGVATYRKDIVKNGVLQTLLYNRETAAKAGRETTANASKGSYSSPVGISPYAFCIEAGDKTKEDLFKMAEGGIFVTEVKGLHAGANAVTGDFSIESEGFLIENGKAATPVKSFTIAGNFFDLINNIDSIGNDLEISLSGGTTVFGAPSVFVKEMSVAGE